MPALKVMIFFGGSAQKAARLLERAYPGVLARRGITTLTTYHPGRQALWTPDPAERDRREGHLLDALKVAAELVTGVP